MSAHDPGSGSISSTVLLGIGLKVLAVFLFTIMLSLGKGYAEYPLAEIVFFRSFFALVVLVAWLAWRGAFPAALYTKRLPAHLVRSLAGVGSMFFIFASYALLPLADATAIGYVQPLMVALLAWIILRERITRLRIVSIIVGFTGVMIMLWEHLGAGAAGAAARSPLGAFCALAGAFLVAIAFIQIRRLTVTEDTGAIAFYFQTCTTIAAVAVLAAAAVVPGEGTFNLIAGQAWVWPRAVDWLPLIAIGVLGGMGQILMTQGFRYADASILAVFDYTSLIWAVAIGLAVFGEVPSLNTVFGALVVIGAGLAVLWQENERRKARRG